MDLHKVVKKRRRAVVKTAFRITKNPHEQPELAFKKIQDKPVTILMINTVRQKKYDL